MPCCGSPPPNSLIATTPMPPKISSVPHTALSATLKQFTAGSPPTGAPAGDYPSVQLQISPAGVESGPGSTQLLDLIIHPPARRPQTLRLPGEHPKPRPGGSQRQNSQGGWPQRGNNRSSGPGRQRRPAGIAMTGIPAVPLTPAAAADQLSRSLLVMAHP